MLRSNAAVLAGADWSVPVVLAGNAAVRDEVAAVLRDGGLPVTEADNVLPDIGRLAPESARAAIREVFLEHVIGGDRLSTDPRLRSWVRAVTPDAVLEGVAVLARVLAADEVSVVVLDVGGATTDVYCVPDPDAEQATLGREAVGIPARRRTVEGDLGCLVERRRAAARPRRPRDCPSRARTRWPSARRRPRSRCAGTCGPRPPTGPAARVPGRPGWSCCPAGSSGTADPTAVDAAPRAPRRRHRAAPGACWADGR